jgi:DNA-binding transcriptional LysR family regulator
MTAAANELGVTHGAVSHHIKALEAQFGVTLLRRLPHAVATTTEGTQLAASLADAFKLIHLGVSRLQPGPLMLSCSATIMMYWLIPRLEGSSGTILGTASGSSTHLLAPLARLDLAQARTGPG